MIWNRHPKLFKPRLPTWALAVFVACAVGGFVKAQAQDDNAPDFIAPAR